MTKDLGCLCCLISEAGGEIYQSKRFFPGVYALTNSMDRESEEQIFDYKFDGASCEGMFDQELLENLTSLHFLGLVERKRVKLNESENTKHYLTKLTEKGRGLAYKTKMSLSASKLNNLKTIASDLHNDGLTSRDLLKKYGPKWSN